MKKRREVRKQVDPRIRTLIENGVKQRFRTFFVVVGDKSREQVVNLHYMLSKALVKTRPSVLWCYKKDLGFTTHQKKRQQEIKKKIQRGLYDPDKDDPFELFISSTNIRYTYYSESHKILGNTYGMCVLQDFEALTPNLLARTIETVEGGGLVILLLKTMTSLKQLYSMAMDVHTRFRTESQHDVTGRFNERFLLSLASCERCLAVDDELNVLPLASHSRKIEPLEGVPLNPSSVEDPDLKELKASLKETDFVGGLVEQSKTLDQAKAILTFIEAISEKTLKTTVTLSAARGRGKSAALGIAIAAAVASGYSNVFITSPSPENLRTLFEFVLKGFDVLDYQEHLDYEVIQSTNPEFNKAVVRINVYRSHRQTVQYIHPQDHAKLGQAELLVIDEAAAIPLPFVKKLLGPYLVFMASTINGYEGTGRSLSLKLIKQLREQSTGGASSRMLKELTMQLPIRYANGDPVESWLNSLLCLDAAIVKKIPSGCPHPSKCNLYYVNRDTLFSYHRASETFLQRMMALYVSSHYKNSPNDLILMSDAPAHHLFVLLGPVDEKQNMLPEILCVIQVCIEGELTRDSVRMGLARGERASGDLIPWTLTQQFQDEDFASLSGARVVRIATHPDYQRMGYGSRALELLAAYYQGDMTNLSEDDHKPHAIATVTQLDGIDNDQDQDQDNDSNDMNIEGGEDHANSQENTQQMTKLHTERLKPRKNLPPLLAKLEERRSEPLHWLGTSFGVTLPLFGFWRKAGFYPVYLRQTPNDLTGEHTCIMMKTLKLGAKTEISCAPNWLDYFTKDFHRRFLSLLAYEFREFEPSLALSILDYRPQGMRPVEVDPTVHSADDYDDDDDDDHSKKNTKANKKKHYADDNNDKAAKRMAAIKRDLDFSFSRWDVKRLESYANNMLDYHVIVDLVPMLTRYYFLGKLSRKLEPVTTMAKHSDAIARNEGENGVSLPYAQAAVLLGLGLQHKSVDQLLQELNIQANQVLALFSKSMKKFAKYFRAVDEWHIDRTLPSKDAVPLATAGAPLGSLDEELAAKGEGALEDIHARQAALIEALGSQFAIRGTDDDWQRELSRVKQGKVAKSVSIKRSAPPQDPERKAGIKKAKQQQNDSEAAAGKKKQKRQRERASEPVEDGSLAAAERMVLEKKMQKKKMREKKRGKTGN